MNVTWTVVALVLVVFGTAASGQANRCADRPDFSFVKDEEYCYRFSICINGFPYPMRCSGDLWFDEEAQSCGSSELVTCDVETPTTPAPVPGICDGVKDNELVLHPYFCNTYFICIGEVGTPVVCPSGMWFDRERQICGDPADISCPHGPAGAARCRSEENLALVPSNRFCNRYYQCVNGFPFPMICPDNQWFDAVRDVCDDRSSMQCDMEPGEPVEPPPLNICDATPNNFLTAHPTACNKYFVCVNQVGWSKMCPLNLWFDAAGQTCVRAGVVDCPLGPPMPPETTTTPFSRCDDVPNLSFVAGDEFCYRYYQCRNGVPFPMICPGNLWFSEQAQDCLDPETVQCDNDDSPPPVTPTPGVCTDVENGAFVRHPLHCNQYYLCVGELGISLICPAGQWFDEPNQTCNSPLNVECPHGPTTPAPDPFAVCHGIFEYHFVRNQDYCYRYIQCIGGTPFPLICHDGMWFDEDRQTCDRSDYVECDGIEPPIVRPPDHSGICEGIEDGILAPHDTFCNEYFLCVHEIGWPIICPIGLWFDEEQQTCSPAGRVSCKLAPEHPPVTESPYAMCKGIPENAYVRDSEYCYRFFKCVSGSPFPMTCPVDQFFDERQQRCRNSTEVTCPIEDQTRPPPTAGVCVGVENSVQVPNRRTCNQFYTCVDEVPFPQICGVGLWFDEARQTCSQPWETTCDLGPPTTTTNAPHPWALCEDVPNYSYVPSPNYCYRFFQCIDGAPFPMTCSGNLWFDPDRQICANPEEVACIVNPNPPIVPPTPGICSGIDNGRQVRGPRACNQFYVCVDEIGYSLVCPDGLWFDEFHQICSAPSYTYCPLAPVVTTPSPYERCENVPDLRMVRNDFYCYRYYQCVNDVPYPMICRAGLWFDVERQLCDLSLNVHCDLRPGSPGPIIPTPAICEGIPNGNFERNWNFCNQYYLCVDEEAYPQICPDGLWFDDYRQSCDRPEKVYCPLGASTAEPTPEERCYGVPDLSYLSNDGYCYRYFQCVDGVPYPLICNSHLWFSEESQSCLTTDEVSCEGENHPPVVPPTEGICTGVENGRQVLHPVFCNQFYVCIDEVGFAQICPFGLWFDEPQQSCSSPPDVECPHGLVPTASPIENICLDKPTGAKVANPIECEWFYICIDGNPFRSPCPEQMLFDRNLLQCVPADEADCATVVTTVPTPGPCYGVEDYTLVRNPYNCAGYYECVGGYGRPSYCPPGEYFSEELQQCDAADNVDCSVEGSSPEEDEEFEKLLSMEGVEII
ncbi:uncharacterized protein LOC131685836 [Topomyia yanbarensis]|uniref:uncharacterized protein LOC131685836 n=1 Tax=Topomyia yanbarensis TaxID=2498891 RepID=UPI00273CC54D|nr:uncharacterized protein LOC131685836 [Topomyia yanbarensis]